jgi:hypothetical protein
MVLSSGGTANRKAVVMGWRSMRTSRKAVAYHRIYKTRGYDLHIFPGHLWGERSQVSRLKEIRLLVEKNDQQLG